MKSLPGIIKNNRINKSFICKCFLLSIIILFVFIRISPFFSFLVSPPSSTGFSLRSITKVKGTLLCRPTITKGGCTGFKILMVEVINHRGWHGYISAEAFVIVKGDLSNRLMKGDFVELDSCCFFLEDKNRSDQNERRDKSLCLSGELISQKSPTRWKGLVQRVRRLLLIRLDNRIEELPYRSEMLFRALILGEKGKIDPILRENIALVGCSHLLALSGFHVSILITMIVLLFKRILGERRTLILTIPLLLVYLFLVGLFPSLIRAVIMSLTGSIMVLSCRQKNKVFILFLSLFLQITIFPQTVFTVSFLLSYGAIVGIFFYTPMVDRVLFRFIPVCFSRLFSVSIGAQIVNIPFVFYIFKVLYPIGLIVQIIITPCITLFVWIGFSYLLFSLIPPFFPGNGVVLVQIGMAMEWIYILVSQVCRLFSSPGFLGIHSFAGCCIFFFVLLIPLLFMCVKRWRDSIAYRNFYDRL